jgi:hypothetical protein
MCLSPKIPDYLYAEPDLVWSNIVNDEIPDHQPAYPEGFPHLAFQPPYFLSRKTIKGLLAVAGDIRANPTMPFIDHYMIQLAIRAGLPYKSFLDGVSCPISWDPPSANLAEDAVRHRGCTLMHSIKRKQDLNRMIGAREDYVRAHP